MARFKPVLLLFLLTVFGAVFASLVPSFAAASGLALDFEVANGGNEILFNCDAGVDILNNTSLPNTGHFLYCAGEAFRASGCSPTLTTTPSVSAAQMPSFAASNPKKCKFKGTYAFVAWDPSAKSAASGNFSVSNGLVLPGGIIECNVGGTTFQSYIESGNVFLERDCEGTMLIQTNGPVCGATDALELDISVVSGGKSVLFNANGADKVASGTVPNTGHTIFLTGRGDKAFFGGICGCYDARFWSADDNFVGDCTVCVDAVGNVTNGSCRCNAGGEEYLSEIETGAYTLPFYTSSTGYLWFETSSDEICGVTPPSPTPSPTPTATSTAATPTPTATSTAPTATPTPTATSTAATPTPTATSTAPTATPTPTATSTAATPTPTATSTAATPTPTATSTAPTATPTPTATPSPIPAIAPVLCPVPEPTPGNYAVLAGQSVTTVPTTTINGNLGISPGAAPPNDVTGGPTVTGFTDDGNAAAGAGQSLKDTAEGAAFAQIATATTISDELGGQTLGPGVYKSASTTFKITTGTLALDSGGDANAVWIFLAESTATSLTTGAGTSVSFVSYPSGTGVACNVFWQLAGTATLGTSSTFQGSIMASTSITVGNSTTVNGRLLANTGSVSLGSSGIGGVTVNGCTCLGEPTPGG